MATTPSARPRGPASATRSRTGCWPCRDRGVKCDEAIPRCKKCTRSDVPCQYGIRLQWVEDSKARGVCHGRQGVWSSSHKKQKQLHGPRSWNWELQNHQSIAGAAISACLDPHGANTTGYFFLNTFVDDIDTYMTGTSDDDEYADISGCELVDDTQYELNRKRYATALNDIRRAPTFRNKAGPFGTLQSALFTSVSATNGSRQPLDTLDGNIIEYYDTVVAREAVILDDEACNPFRYLIMPMAFASSTILSAILVIGATKLSHLDSRYRAKALVHRQSLFRDLAKRLRSVQSDLTSFSEALVSVLILCWSDITDHCRPSWLNHMMGISSIISTAPLAAFNDPLTSKIMLFCRQYLFYHLVMARATFCVDKLLPGWKPALTPLLDGFTPRSAPPSPVILPTRLSSRLDSSEVNFTVSSAPEASIDLLQHMQNASATINDPNEINTHQGFSNSLLLIINDLSDLAKHPRFEGMSDDFHSMNSLHQLLQRVNKLSRRIENIVQIAPKALQQRSHVSWNLPNPFLDDDEWRRLRQQEQLVGVVTATAEANRLGCLLFLDNMCAQRFPGIIPSCRSDREKTIQNILSLAEKVCSAGSVTAALPIWPVFLAACAVNEEKDRIRVLSVLDAFRGNQALGSLPPACAVIESVWRQRDLACDDKVASQRSSNPQPAGSPIRGSSAVRKEEDQCVEKNQWQDTAIDHRYPWEKAMLILKGPVLSLT